MSTSRSTDRHRVALAFAVVLKNARHAHGMMQETLAEVADIDRTYPSLLERGLRQPTLAYLFALADALKEDPADLVRRTYRELYGQPATATLVTAFGAPVNQEADRDTPARLPFQIESGRQRR